MSTTDYYQTIRANFCPNCHSLLELPSAKGQVNCIVCGYESHVSEQTDLSNEIVTRLTKRKAMESTMKSKTEFAAKMTDGSVECPKCFHQELFFKTAQLRSADEGQTVFYECCKCSFTWSVNT